MPDRNPTMIYCVKLNLKNDLVIKFTAPTTAFVFNNGKRNMW
jgi:hypothetical protein